MRRYEVYIAEGDKIRVVVINADYIHNHANMVIFGLRNHGDVAQFCIDNIAGWKEAPETTYDEVKP